MKYRMLKEDCFFYPQRKGWLGWDYFWCLPDIRYTCMGEIECRQFLDEVSCGKRDKNGDKIEIEPTVEILNYP